MWFVILLSATWTTGMHTQRAFPTYGLETDVAWINNETAPATENHTSNTSGATTPTGTTTNAMDSLIPTTNTSTGTTPSTTSTRTGTATPTSTQTVTPTKTSSTTLSESDTATGCPEDHEDAPCTPGECTYLHVDPNNCGSCGIRCEPGFYCDNYACVPYKQAAYNKCPSGQLVIHNPTPVQPFTVWHETIFLAHPKESKKTLKEYWVQVIGADDNSEAHYTMHVANIKFYLTRYNSRLLKGRALAKAPADLSFSITQNVHAVQEVHTWFTVTITRTCANRGCPEGFYCAREGYPPRCSLGRLRHSHNWVAIIGYALVSIIFVCALVVYRRHSNKAEPLPFPQVDPTIFTKVTKFCRARSLPMDAVIYLVIFEYMSRKNSYQAVRNILDILNWAKRAGHGHALCIIRGCTVPGVQRVQYKTVTGDAGQHKGVFHATLFQLLTGKQIGKSELAGIASIDGPFEFLYTSLETTEGMVSNDKLIQHCIEWPSRHDPDLHFLSNVASFLNSGNQSSHVLNAIRATGRNPFKDTEDSMLQLVQNSDTNNDVSLSEVVNWVMEFYKQNHTSRRNQSMASTKPEMLATSPQLLLESEYLKVPNNQEWTYTRNSTPAVHPFIKDITEALHIKQVRCSPVWVSKVNITLDQPQTPHRCVVAVLCWEAKPGVPRLDSGLVTKDPVVWRRLKANEMGTLGFLLYPKFTLDDDHRLHVQEPSQLLYNWGRLFGPFRDCNGHKQTKPTRVLKSVVEPLDPWDEDWHSRGWLERAKYTTTWFMAFKIRFNSTTKDDRLQRVHDYCAGGPSSERDDSNRRIVDYCVDGNDVIAVVKGHEKDTLQDFPKHLLKYKPDTADEEPLSPAIPLGLERIHFELDGTGLLRYMWLVFLISAIWKIPVTNEGAFVETRINNGTTITTRTPNPTTVPSTATVSTSLPTTLTLTTNRTSNSTGTKTGIPTATPTSTITVSVTQTKSTSSTVTTSVTMSSTTRTSTTSASQSQTTTTTLTSTLTKSTTPTMSQLSTCSVTQTNTRTVAPASVLPSTPAPTLTLSQRATATSTPTQTLTSTIIPTPPSTPTSTPTPTSSGPTTTTTSTSTQTSSGTTTIRRASTSTPTLTPTSSRTTTQTSTSTQTSSGTTSTTSHTGTTTTNPTALTITASTSTTNTMSTSSPTTTPATMSSTTTGTSTASTTPSRTTTATHTSTPTKSTTPTMSQSPTFSTTNTGTATTTRTSTSSYTRTPTPTLTLTATSTSTSTESPTTSPTPTSTSTSTATPTSTPTLTSTKTDPSSRTSSKTASSTPTRTPTPTSTRTLTSTPSPSGSRTTSDTPTRTGCPEDHDMAPCQPNGACTYIHIDPDHCGGCGVKCDPGFYCDNYTCASYKAASNECPSRTVHDGMEYTWILAPGSAEQQQVACGRLLYDLWVPTNLQELYHVSALFIDSNTTYAVHTGLRVDTTSQLATDSPHYGPLDIQTGRLLSWYKLKHGDPKPGECLRLGSDGRTVNLQGGPCDDKLMAICKRTIHSTILSKCSTPLDCDDSDPCTEDICNTQCGDCVHPLREKMGDDCYSGEFIKVNPTPEQPFTSWKETIFLAHPKESNRTDKDYWVQVIGSDDNSKAQYTMVVVNQRSYLARHNSQLLEGRAQFAAPADFTFEIKQIHPLTEPVRIRLTATIIRTCLENHHCPIGWYCGTGHPPRCLRLKQPVGGDLLAYLIPMIVSVDPWYLIPIIVAVFACFSLWYWRPAWCKLPLKNNNLPPPSEVDPAIWGKKPLQTMDPVVYLVLFEYVSWETRHTNPVSTLQRVLDIINWAARARHPGARWVVHSAGAGSGFKTRTEPYLRMKTSYGDPEHGAFISEVLHEHFTVRLPFNSSKEKLIESCTEWQLVSPQGSFMHWLHTVLLAALDTLGSTVTEDAVIKSFVTQTDRHFADVYFLHKLVDAIHADPERELLHSIHRGCISTAHGALQLYMEQDEAFDSSKSLRAIRDLVQKWQSRNQTRSTHFADILAASPQPSILTEYVMSVHQYHADFHRDCRCVDPANRDLDIRPLTMIDVLNYAPEASSATEQTFMSCYLRNCTGCPALQLLNHHALLGWNCSKFVQAALHVEALIHSWQLWSKIFVKKRDVTFDKTVHVVAIPCMGEEESHKCTQRDLLLETKNPVLWRCWKGEDNEKAFGFLLYPKITLDSAGYIHVQEASKLLYDWGTSFGPFQDCGEWKKTKPTQVAECIVKPSLSSWDNDSTSNRLSGAFRNLQSNVTPPKDPNWFMAVTIPFDSTNKSYLLQRVYDYCVRGPASTHRIIDYCVQGNEILAVLQAKEEGDLHHILFTELFPPTTRLKNTVQQTKPETTPTVTKQAISQQWCNTKELPPPEVDPTIFRKVEKYCQTESLPMVVSPLVGCTSTSSDKSESGYYSHSTPTVDSVLDPPVGQVRQSASLQDENVGKEPDTTEHGSTTDDLLEVGTAQDISEDSSMAEDLPLETQPVRFPANLHQEWDKDSYGHMINNEDYNKDPDVSECSSHADHFFRDPDELYVSDSASSCGLPLPVAPPPPLQPFMYPQQPVAHLTPAQYHKPKSVRQATKERPGPFREEILPRRIAYSKQVAIQHQQQKI